MFGTTFVKFPGRKPGSDALLGVSQITNTSTSSRGQV
jgi:hypothetical protein